MNAVDVIRRLHEHRIWANHHLLERPRTSPESRSAAVSPSGKDRSGNRCPSVCRRIRLARSPAGQRSGGGSRRCCQQAAGQSGRAGADRVLEGLRDRLVGARRSLAEYLAELADEALDQPVVRWRRPASWPGSGCRPLGRRAAARLHACRIHHGAGGQHAAATGSREASRRDADFAGPTADRSPAASVLAPARPTLPLTLDGPSTVCHPCLALPLGRQ